MLSTEDEIKYERQRLRSERIVRTQRLEEDLRSKRIASTYIVKCDEEEEELEACQDEVRGMGTAQVISGVGTEDWRSIRGFFICLAL